MITERENTKTLVLTSVNPHGDLGYQRRCIQQWDQLGYIIRSFNNEHERQLLLNAGFTSQHLVQVSNEETAQASLGKTIPRILPVLNWAAEQHHGPVLLTNADIFPAHRRPVSAYLQQFCETAALTRNECLDPHGHRYSDRVHYRGGLDMFYFSPQMLRPVVDRLNAIPLSEGMTFGVPGWDFFLFHILRTDGEFLAMDGEVFLHKTHRATYGALDDFSPYAEEIIKSGLYSSLNRDDLAAEIADLIASSCVRNKSISSSLRLIYFQPPTLRPESLSNKEALGIEHLFSSLLKSSDFDIQYDRAKLLALIAAQLSGVQWVIAENNVSSIAPLIHPVDGQLLLLALLLFIRKTREDLNICYHYTNPEPHKAVMRYIMECEHGPGFHARIFSLFAAELVEHSVFNPNLYKYLVLNCTSSQTLRFYDFIFSLCKEEA